MPHKCCAPGCHSNYNESLKARVFSFPRDEKLIEQWLKAISKENFQPSKSSKLCEKHFKPEDIITEASAFDPRTNLTITAPLKIYRLKRDAIPSIFPRDFPIRQQKSQKMKGIAATDDLSVGNSEDLEQSRGHSMPTKSAKSMISQSPKKLSSGVSQRAVGGPPKVPVGQQKAKSPTTYQPIIVKAEGMNMESQEEDVDIVEVHSSPKKKSEPSLVHNEKILIPSPYKNLPTVTVCLKKEDRVVFSKELQKSVKRSLSVGSNSSNGSSEAFKVATPQPQVKRRKVDKAPPSVKGRQNDVFCWMCHREGVALECFACPRAFHHKCANEYEMVPDWVCPECQRILAAENVDTRSSTLADISLDKLCVLLKCSLNKLKYRAPAAFHQPVPLDHYSSYLEYVIHPMDFSEVEKNIRLQLYGCTEAFLADVKWILHNSCVFNGTHHPLSTNAKSLVKLCETDMQEIEVCPDCFMHGSMRSKYWFSEICKKPHPLVWAKLKGFPYWPAKVVRILDGNVDARFFGAHDRAWVPTSQCYHLSKEMPTSSKPKKKGTYDSALDELNVHVHLLIQKFGTFEYAPYRTSFDPENSYLFYHGIDIDKISKEEISYDANTDHHEELPSPPSESMKLLKSTESVRSEDSFMEPDPESNEVPEKPMETEDDDLNSDDYSLIDKLKNHLAKSELEKRLVASEVSKNTTKKFSEASCSKEAASEISKNSTKEVSEASCSKEIASMIDESSSSEPKTKPVSTDEPAVNSNSDDTEQLKKLEMALERIKGYISNTADSEKNVEENMLKSTGTTESESPKDTDVKKDDIDILADIPDDSESEAKEETPVLNIANRKDSFFLKLNETIESCKAKLGISEIVDDEESSGSESIEEDDDDENESSSSDDEDEEDSSSSDNETNSEASDTDVEEREVIDQGSSVLVSPKVNEPTAVVEVGSDGDLSAAIKVGSDGDESAAIKVGSDGDGSSAIKFVSDGEKHEKYSCDKVAVDSVIGNENISDEVECDSVAVQDSSAGKKGIESNVGSDGEDDADSEDFASKAVFHEKEVADSDSVGEEESDDENVASEFESSDKLVICDKESDSEIEDCEVSVTEFDLSSADIRSDPTNSVSQIDSSNKEVVISDSNKSVKNDDIAKKPDADEETMEVDDSNTSRSLLAKIVNSPDKSSLHDESMEEKEVEKCDNYRTLPMEVSSSHDMGKVECDTKLTALKEHAAEEIVKGNCSEDDDILICEKPAKPEPPLICLDDGTDNETDVDDEKGTFPVETKSVSVKESLKCQNSLETKKANDGGNIPFLESAAPKNLPMQKSAELAQYLLSNRKQAEKSSEVSIKTAFKSPISGANGPALPLETTVNDSTLPPPINAGHRRHARAQFAKFCIEDRLEFSDDEVQTISCVTNNPLSGAKRTFSGSPSSSRVQEISARQMSPRIHRQTSQNSDADEKCSIDKSFHKDLENHIDGSRRTAFDTSKAGNNNIILDDSTASLHSEEAEDEIRKLKHKITLLTVALQKQHWCHAQEKAELRHNMNLIIMEMRASLEADKKHAIEVLSKQLEKEKAKAIEETKKKQWCASCRMESRYACCWNTSYCTPGCQKRHFQHHMKFCGQLTAQKKATQATEVAKIISASPVSNAESTGEKPPEKKIFVVNLKTTDASKMPISLTPSTFTPPVVSKERLATLVSKDKIASIISTPQAIKPKPVQLSPSVSQPQSAQASSSSSSSTATSSPLQLVQSPTVQIVYTKPANEMSGVNHPHAKIESMGSMADSADIIHCVRKRMCDLGTAISLLKMKNDQSKASIKKDEPPKAEEANLEDIYFPMPRVKFEGYDCDETVTASDVQGDEQEVSDVEMEQEAEDKMEDSAVENELLISEEEDVESEKVSIGYGIEVSAKLLDKCLIFGQSPKKLTRCLVEVIFPDIKLLATCSAFGQKSHITKLTRAALPTNKVRAIIDFVQKRYPDTLKSEITLAINMKCKEARKVLGRRKESSDRPIRKTLLKRILANDNEDSKVKPKKVLNLKLSKLEAAKTVTSQSDPVPSSATNVHSQTLFVSSPITTSSSPNTNSKTLFVSSPITTSSSPNTNSSSPITFRIAGPVLSSSSSAAASNATLEAKQYVSIPNMKSIQKKLAILKQKLTTDDQVGSTTHTITAPTTLVVSATGLRKAMLPAGLCHQVSSPDSKTKLVMAAGSPSAGQTVFSSSGVQTVFSPFVKPVSAAATQPTTQRPIIIVGSKVSPTLQSPDKQQASSVKKTRKKRSWVWKYFSKIPGEIDTVNCSICSQRYQTSYTTSTLALHLKRKHKVRLPIPGQIVKKEESSQEKNN